MNNIFLNNDPLLYRNQLQLQDQNDLYKQIYQQQFLKDTYMQSADFIGDLDKCLKDLEPSVSECLQKDPEWSELNIQLLSAIQSEIISIVKYRLNQNTAVMENVNKQKDIIKRYKQQVKDTERQNLMLLNDYMKNYSNMTFDEYKKIKEEK